MIRVDDPHRIQAFSRAKALSWASGSPVSHGSFRERMARSPSTSSGINSMVSSRGTSSNLLSSERPYFSLTSFGMTMRPCLSMVTSKWHHHMPLPLFFIESHRQTPIQPNRPKVLVQKAGPGPSGEGLLDSNPVSLAIWPEKDMRVHHRQFPLFVSAESFVSTSLLGLAQNILMARPRCLNAQ